MTDSQPKQSLEQYINQEVERLREDLSKLVPTVGPIELRVVNHPELYAYFMAEIDETFYPEDVAYGEHDFTQDMGNSTFFGVFAHAQGKPLAYVSGNQDFDDIPKKLQSDTTYRLSSIAYNKKLLEEPEGFEVLKSLFTLFETTVARIGYDQMLVHKTDEEHKDLFEQCGYALHWFYKNYYAKDQGAALVKKQLTPPTDGEVFTQDDFNRIRKLFNQELQIGYRLIDLLDNQFGFLQSVVQGEIYTPGMLDELTWKERKKRIWSWAGQASQENFKIYFDMVRQKIEAHLDGFETRYPAASELLAEPLQPAVMSRGAKRVGLELLEKIIEKDESGIFENVEVVTTIPVNVIMPFITAFFDIYLQDKVSLRGEFLADFNWAEKLSRAAMVVAGAIVSATPKEDADIILRSNSTYEFGGPSGLLQSTHEHAVHEYGSDEKRKSDLAIFQTETGRQLFLNIFDFLYKQNWGMIPQGVKYFPLANEYIQPDKSGFIYSSRKGDFEQRTFLECTVGQGDAISQGNNSIYVEMRDGKAQLVRKTFKGRYPKNLVVPEIKGVYKSRKRNGILQKKWKDGTSIVNGCRSPHTETELAKLEKIAKQVEAELGFPVKIEYLQKGDKIYLTQVDPIDKEVDDSIETKLDGTLIGKSPFVNKPFQTGEIKIYSGDNLYSADYKFFDRRKVPFALVVGSFGGQVSPMLYERLVTNPLFRGIIFDSALSFAAHNVELSVRYRKELNANALLDETALIGIPGIIKKLNMHRAYDKGVNYVDEAKGRFVLSSTGVRGSVYKVK
ncbi:hypothetical protein HN587_03235 [Candidatus Woesearchaeota archaeon]|jgi:hypothetical protein|nr:hypothetical protein [Candidatus Woesearchaeota archaeon]